MRDGDLDYDLPRGEGLTAYAPMELYTGPGAPFGVASFLLADLAVRRRVLVARLLNFSACHNNRGTMVLHACPY